MKKILILSAVLSISLASHSGVTADLAIPVAVAPTQVAVAAQEIRLSPQQIRPAAVQMAAIGAPTNSGSAGSLREAPPDATGAVSGGLPSTPIALASLLLMLCILIGRRNS